MFPLLAFSPLTKYLQAGIVYTILHVSLNFLCVLCFPVWMSGSVLDCLYTHSTLCSQSLADIGVPCMHHRASNVNQKVVHHKWWCIDHNYTVMTALKMYSLIKWGFAFSAALQQVPQMEPWGRKAPHSYSIIIFWKSLESLGLSTGISKFPVVFSECQIYTCSTIFEH